MVRLRLLPLLCLVATCTLPRVLAEDADLSLADMELLLAEDAPTAAAALAQGADIDARAPKNGQTALLLHVQQGRTSMAAWALEHGADARLASTDGTAPINAAALNGDVDMLALLKRHGVGLRDLYGGTEEPVMRACYGSEEKHTRAVAWFLDNGVPFEAVYTKCMLFTGDTNAGTKELLLRRSSEMVKEL